MFGNKEVATEYIIELASSSKNDKIKEFGPRIRELVEESKKRAENGAGKLVGVVVSGGLELMVLTSAWHRDVHASWPQIAFFALIPTAALACSAARDLNAAALARGSIATLSSLVITDSVRTPQ